ncbi:MAG TPA: hypothetical protein VGJ60_28230 [Chloroflexota bacterium]|jgi:hypothetical protein
MNGQASVQATSIDVVWIRDRVVCLGSRRSDRRYRGVLAAEGPPEAFGQEIERLQPLLDGFAGFLNGLGQPAIGSPAGIQIMVRAERADLSAHAARLEARARQLPETWASEVRGDAAWARQVGPDLGLLARRAYVVVPAESLPGPDVAGRLHTARSRLGNLFRAGPELDEAAARDVLDIRCGDFVDRLARGGVRAQRLDDPALTRLFQTCWSRRRDRRFDQNLRICAPPGSDWRF